MKMLMAAMIGTAMATGASAAPFESFRWEKRLLLVFAQDGDAKAQTQRRILSADGMRERDLVLIDVPRDGALKAVSANAEAVRRAYAVAEDASFTVILVGKDGGVKQRANEPISARDLFAAIDAMPMRANEMRRK